jgi:hypothetical protein
LEDLGVDGRILKYILSKQYVEEWAEIIWLILGINGWIFKELTLNKMCVIL